MRNSHVNFPCSACGAQLQFRPGIAKMNCEYCGHVQDVPQPQTESATPVQIQEHDYLTALQNPKTVSPAELVQSATEVECKNCSAITIVTGQATSCPFCDSPVVAKEDKEGIIFPESVLPFKVEKNKAKDIFQSWIKSRWFAPSDLVQRAQKEGIDGVYLPYWTYDSDTNTTYRGERGEHYYVEEEYTDSEGNTKTRRERKTRWYDTHGSVRQDFDDVMICASKSLPQKLFNALEPWPTNELQPYAPGYLAGFSAEKYAITLPEGFKLAESKMETEIKKEICRDIGGDEQRISSFDTRHHNVTFKHVLLPLWISSFRYNDKVYRVIINAQTGQMTGERPYSAMKIALLVITIIIVLVALVSNG